MTTRGKRPAFQWYPGDHRRDTGVQACSFEARALWREMLDLMHDGEPYGHLTAGGATIDAAALARIVGIAPARARKLLAELEERKVFSRTAAGVIYSRRMVKDEHIREVRANAGSKGGNPLLNAPPPINPSDKPTDIGLVKQNGKQNPTPAVAVAVATAEERTTTPSSPPARALVSARIPASYAPDVEALFGRIQSHTHESWARSLLALLDGMHPLGGGLPNATPPDALGEALRQLNTNDAAPNWKLFLAYVRAVLRDRAEAGASARDEAAPISENPFTVLRRQLAGGAS